MASPLVSVVCGKLSTDSEKRDALAASNVVAYGYYPVVLGFIADHEVVPLCIVQFTCGRGFCLYKERIPANMCNYYE